MFSEFLTTENLLFIVTGLAIIIIMLVANRLVRRAIARYSKRLKIEPHVENVFKLTARIACMHYPKSNSRIIGLI